jgi:hypothetical protein
MASTFEVIMAAYRPSGRPSARPRPIRDNPRPGEDADPASRHAGGAHNQLTGRHGLVRWQTYEITFAGQAGTTLRAEFDDCQVTIGRGTTTLRAELPDQAALAGLVQRITGLGLEVVDLHLVAPAPAP